MKKLLSDMWHTAAAHNKRNVLEALGRGPNKMLLDLGCWDGDWTSTIAKSIGTTHTHGVEIVDSAAKLASGRGVTVIKADLGEPLPIADHSYDIVHANQVIEHVPDVDVFMGEIYRVLRPGGHAVVSTENGSSWCNVFASAMGWQMFSATNISTRSGGLGNPFALHRTEGGAAAPMRHKTIFNYCGLVEFSRAHGFSDVKVFGAGYFPLPSSCGAIDPRHSHFITVRLTKP